MIDEGFPFYSAQEAIQWVFNSSRSSPTFRTSRSKIKRPCETSDIIITAKHLKERGEITAGQYLMFDKFVRGDVKKFPDSLAEKWKDFLSKMNNALIKKNIVMGDIAW